MNITTMNAKIFGTSDNVTIASGDEVEDEAQGRFVVAKITSFACKRSLCTKDEEPWNYSYKKSKKGSKLSNI